MVCRKVVTEFRTLHRSLCPFCPFGWVLCVLTHGGIIVIPNRHNSIWKFFSVELNKLTLVVCKFVRTNEEEAKCTHQNLGTE
jgi:hypothetical protein